MDDFEYSLYISDQDWETFYRECEGCNLLCPGLASREDSSVSDVDEMVYHSINLPPPPGAASAEADPDLQIDGPPDCEGSPVDSYLSKYGVLSPEQVLSGSEEDLHLQTVNLFFEQLKGVVVPKQPLEESHAANWGSEKTDHLEGLNVNQVIQSVDISPPGRNEASLTGETAKQGELDTWSCTALEEAVVPTSTDTKINASDFTERELVGIEGEPSLLQIVTEGIKHKQEKLCCDLSTELKLKPEAKLPDTERMTRVVVADGRQMPDANPEKESKTQLETGSSTDSPSNLRRKRRKKRRVCNESRETRHGYEAQLRVHQSESEEERFTLREEINCLTTNVRRTEHPSLQRIQTSSTPHHTDHLLSSFSFASESTDGLKYSKSLPVSFTTFASDSKSEVRHASINNISRSKSDMFLLNSRPLETELCQLSMLPQIHKVLNSQESGIGLTESDSITQLEDTDCSPALSRSDITETFSDSSAAGCRRKFTLSANISSAADSTETLSSSLSLSVTEDTCEDVSCLDNEINCCAFKNEQNMPSKMTMRRNSDTQASSLSSTENTLETQSGSDRNSLTVFSQETSTAFEHVDITKTQTSEISTDSPLSKKNSQCHMTDEKHDSHIQNLNKSCEVLIVNDSQINSTDDLDSGNEDGDSCHAVAEKSNADLFCDRTSSENIIMLSEDASAVVLDDQIPSPVFAVSSFWNEMEKLTINDILRLRMISNAQHPSVLTRPEDGIIVDTNDAADSDYFTQLDESKPDHSSGDMSFISDLDEDLTQLQSQLSLKQEDELPEFPSRSCSVAWENDSDPTITGNNIMFFGSESSLPEHLNTANAQQGFRNMCENISVQDLQAVEAQPVRPMIRKTSLHSIHPEAEDPFYHINTSCSACSSDDEEMESCGVTFSEIIQYFFGGEEPERCASRADSNAASSLDETGTCVPEMYDHFFSEFESGSFFNLFEDESGGNKDKMVPIFSCTRSTNRPLQFPEAYDYFFPDSPVHSDEDDESDSEPITVVTRYDHESPNRCPVSAIDMYEHFYPEDTFQGNFLWANPFSFRRHTDPAVSEDESCSWTVTPVKPHTGIQAGTVMGPDDRPFPETFYLSLENHIFQQLAEQQKKCMEMQTVIADPRLDAPFLPLGQADMCLICIAFASWVLKSASPAADTWKAALLANVSALSAIRYLRRHKKEVSGKAPLLQIESV